MIGKLTECDLRQPRWKDVFAQMIGRFPNLQTFRLRGRPLSLDGVSALDRNVVPRLLEGEFAGLGLGTLQALLAGTTLRWLKLHANIRDKHTTSLDGELASPTLEELHLSGKFRIEQCLLRISCPLLRELICDDNFWPGPSPLGIEAFLCEVRRQDFSPKVEPEQFDLPIRFRRNIEVISSTAQ
eukprot:gnl/TRDRNA2_/TRDRNA2_138491_c1_seq2.p1 gnl/TRDRNA2_/TRDRNA2_138491_c1~~gnl/TRDRNA2_/TRDRNA2_138491_c1_seq2.p1  ORF type:complete len:191 (+),score=9.07 gnl/TRDRNA2_/TRDRNA2_138491_c1_seq2:24-575(+)